jgi:hypothetical protein
MICYASVALVSELKKTGAASTLPVYKLKKLRRNRSIVGDGSVQFVRKGAIAIGTAILIGGHGGIEGPPLMVVLVEEHQQYLAQHSHEQPTPDGHRESYEVPGGRLRDIHPVISIADAHDNRRPAPPPTRNMRFSLTRTEAFSLPSLHKSPSFDLYPYMHTIK